MSASPPFRTPRFRRLQARNWREADGTPVPSIVLIRKDRTVALVIDAADAHRFADRIVDAAEALQAKENNRDTTAHNPHRGTTPEPQHQPN